MGEPAKPSPAPPITVLLVEDELLVRMMTADLLADMGHRVIAAASAEEALARLREEPEIQLLFTDIRMPGLDGFALAERVFDLHPGIKVIYATGYADLERRPAPHVAGPLLRKPYEPAELDAQIRKAIAPGE